MLKYKGRETRYTVTGVANNVASLEVVSKPTYYTTETGSAPNLSGLSVRVRYTNGTTKTVSGTALKSALAGRFFNLYNTTASDYTPAAGNRVYGGYFADKVKNAGANTFEITYSGASATFDMHGVDGFVAPTSIKLDKTAATLAAQATDGFGELQLAVIPAPAGANAVTLWSSSNTAVTSVSDTGLVTAVAPGTAKITARQNNRTAVCTITVKSWLDPALFSLEQSEYTYSGAAIQPVVVRTGAAVGLKAGTHYTVAYAGNINAGSGSVVLTGRGSYLGTVELLFAISPKALDAEGMSCYVSNDVQYYTGSPLTPVVVKDGSKLLAEGTDYTVEYTNASAGSEPANQAQGTVNVTVTAVEGGNYSGSISNIGFEIVKTPLNDTMVAAIPAQEYIPGHVAVEPELSVAYGVTALEEGTDYSVRYENNTGAGTATAIIEGTGRFEGTVTNSFTIKTRALTKGMAQAVTPKTFTGAAIEPVVVMDGATELEKDADYTITYRNNLKVGTATAVIKGINSYKGSVSVSFKITAKQLETNAVQDITAMGYTGAQLKPVVTVKDTPTAVDTPLVLGRDYTVSYKNNINAAESGAEKAPTVVVKGKGNYSGTLEKSFTIEPKVVTFTISPIKAQVYKGSEIIPALTVKDDRKTLKAGVDYTVAAKSGSSNINAGEAGVTVSGAGNYLGSTGEAMFTINPVAISKAAITLPTHLKQEAAGSEIKAEPTLSFAGAPLAADTDYTLSYLNNTKIGTATVVITGEGNFSGVVRKTYRIVAGNVLEDCTAELAFENSPYTGYAIKPTVTVSDDSETLTLGTHYTVAYKNNVNAGTATVTITGRGTYVGTITETFTVEKKALTGADVAIADVTDKVYTGKEIKPALSIKWTTNSGTKDVVKTLRANSDYTLSWSDNIAQGTATVTATLKGNYDGTLTKTFTITPYSVSRLSVAGIKTQYYSNGAELKPEPVVKFGKTVLKKDVDYTLAYLNNTAVGKATVTVTGKDGSNFAGTKTLTFAIAKHSIKAADVLVEGVSDVVYDGTAKTQPLVVKYDNGTTDGVTLVEGNDYKVVYANNTRVGTARITITGLGVYTGSRVVNFKILGRELDVAEIKTEYKYTGSQMKPVPVVTDKAESEREMKLNRDYTVKYLNNVNAGSATAVVTGKGNYAGRVVETDFDIGPKDAELTISKIKNQNYDGYAKRPALTVKDGKKTLKYGVDYVTGYFYNTYEGTAAVRVTGVGNYSHLSTGSATFEIVMPKMALTGAKNIAPTDPAATGASGNVTLTWRAMPGAGGYVIEYSTVKTFPGNNTQTAAIDGGETVSTTLSGLELGKVWYFRIAMSDTDTPASTADYGTVRSLRVSR